MRTMSLLIRQFILTLFLLVAAEAQDTLRIPYIDYGICPFECCRFGKWVIKSTIPVYKAENDTSAVEYFLKSDDTVFAETGNLHIEQFGKILVTKPINEFNVGDTLIALSCWGEGSYRIWSKGMFREVPIFWSTFADTKRNDRYSGIVIELPKMIWWVKFHNDSGKIGWLRLVNTDPFCFMIEENIQGMDGCG
jgi:hypothetical protein